MRLSQRVYKRDFCSHVFANLDRYIFWHFWQENDVTKFPANFIFSTIGYLMMVSERTHHKDVTI